MTCAALPGIVIEVRDIVEPIDDIWVCLPLTHGSLSDYPRADLARHREPKIGAFSAHRH
jgi:hypothetical protein